jgi:hypothetical protein
MQILIINRELGDFILTAQIRSVQRGQSDIYHYSYPSIFLLFWVNRIWVSGDIAFRGGKIFSGGSTVTVL